MAICPPLEINIFDNTEQGLAVVKYCAAYGRRCVAREKFFAVLKGAKAVFQQLSTEPVTSATLDLSKWPTPEAIRLAMAEHESADREMLLAWDAVSEEYQKVLRGPFATREE